MSESMRGQLLVDTGNQSLVLHHIENGHPAQRTEGLVQEGEIIKGRRRSLRAGCDVRLECVRSHAANRDDPLLVSLAHDPHEAFIQIDMRDKKPASLRYPQTTAVKHLEYGPVTQARPA